MIPIILITIAYVAIISLVIVITLIAIVDYKIRHSSTREGRFGNRPDTDDFDEKQNHSGVDNSFDLK